MNRGGNIGGENRDRNREKVDLFYVSLLWFDYVEKANILVSNLVYFIKINENISRRKEIYRLSAC